MIIDFTMNNYLSIKEEVTFSFLASSKKKYDEIKIIPIENGKFNIYSFSVIYGANASGKTNILKGISELREMIIFSHNLNLDNDIPSYKPFKLEVNNLSMPVKFEIEFIIEKIRYIYMVEFLRKEIVKEELYFFPNGRKSVLFKRDRDKIKYGSKFKGEKKGVETFLLPNRLLLSLSANSKNEFLKPILRFFRDEIIFPIPLTSLLNVKPPIQTTYKIKENDNMRKIVEIFLKSADFGIESIKFIKEEKKSDNILENFLSNLIPKIPEDIKKEVFNNFKFKPKLGHKIYKNGIETDNLEFLDLEKEESSGTFKIYTLSEEIIHVLRTGKTLIIDEFSSNLHPSLNRFLIELFLNPSINKNNAQLLITTHDVSTLDLTILKREQIWFTNKDKNGSTELFSLDEFNDKNLVRNGGKYSKFYLDGRFKAIPNLNKKLLIEELFNA